ncbi:MAG TPA: cupin domain-containing protein [Steroidobacteraceae bacterium]|jgi:hypothetical protein
MHSSRTFAMLVGLILSAAATGATPEDLVHGGVVPLHKIPSAQWIEKVVGDMNAPGQPFVIRVHHDAGYIVLPHTHPEDENITVLRGRWALGTGPRLDLSKLQDMEQGALGFVPKKMAHFGYARVETILQVHGIGPFEDHPIDPAFELTAHGVLAKLSLLKPGVPTLASPPDCFKLNVGARVQSEKGAGMVVGGLCSPANQFTEYWIERPNGERFWATRQTVNPL